MITTVRRMIAVVTVLVFAGVAFAVQNVYGVTKSKTETKAATKAPAAAQAAPQTVKLNIYVLSEAEAEFTMSLEKIDKAATEKAAAAKSAPPAITKNITIKKGVNCITYDKGKKGQYRVTLTAYGDPMVREVTAVQGEYSLFYAIAPPQDGDAKKKVVINQLDLSTIKDKK